MEENINKLIELTTIVKVFDNNSRKIIFGDDYYVSKYQERTPQIELESLEASWNSKWKFFGRLWNSDRQNYRFLYDAFKNFYFSFNQLDYYKVLGVSEAGVDSKREIYLNNLAGINLFGMYSNGKKCIDLLKYLKLINLESDSMIFFNKFSETRNKLIEHNHNPNNLKDIQIDPSIWSLGSTDSLLEVSIHRGAEERVCDVYVDYYKDYFELEKNIVEIIKNF